MPPSRRNRTVLACAIVVALSVIASVCVADGAGKTFERGLEAYNHGRYQAAYAIWSALALQGDANSQSSLAYLYYRGQGVGQDSREAAKWYYRAALQGEPTAQSFLCEMHFRGEGVARDLELALMWCELSIDGGESRGVYFREQAIDMMTDAQRNEAWALVEKWRNAYAGKYTQ